MMTDGTVQLPPDSTGKNLDTTEITRLDGTVVERQRVDLPDQTALLGQIADTLTLLLSEQRRIRLVIEHIVNAEGLGEALEEVT